MNTIEEALEELRKGHLIIVADDPDRENEGDLICAAEHADTANVNFMAKYGKGLICMPMAEKFARKLMIPKMVEVNTDNHETAFTVSIDHVSTSTGISAAERSITAMACVSDDARPKDFRRPGHMFPLIAKAGGVLERGGHTEATVDLMRLAGLKECGLCCEIMDDDGYMMRSAGLREFAEHSSWTGQLPQSFLRNMANSLHMATSTVSTESTMSRLSWARSAMAGICSAECTQNA